MDEIMRSKIRERREALGLTQSRLAEMIGTTQATLNRIESGVTRFSPLIPEILKTLKIDNELADGVEELIVPRLSRKNKTKSRAINAPKLVPATVAPDLPILSTTKTKNGFMELGSAIQYVRRPDELAHVPEAYGAYVVDDSMSPAYSMRDLILIHPYKPPLPGNDVLLYGDISVDGRMTTVCVLRRLVQEDDTNWHTTRWRLLGPDSALGTYRERFSKEAWTRCDVIVARINGG